MKFITSEQKCLCISLREKHAAGLSERSQVNFERSHPSLFTPCSRVTFQLYDHSLKLISLNYYSTRSLFSLFYHNWWLSSYWWSSDELTISSWVHLKITASLSICRYHLCCDDEKSCLHTSFSSRLTVPPNNGVWRPATRCWRIFNSTNSWFWGLLCYSGCCIAVFMDVSSPLCWENPDWFCLSTVKSSINLSHRLIFLGGFLTLKT